MNYKILAVGNGNLYSQLIRRYIMNTKVVVDHEHIDNKIVNDGQYNTNRYYLAGRTGRDGHYIMSPKEFGQALAKKRRGKKHGR